MHGAEEDDEEDGFEEGEENVAAGPVENHDSQDGAHGALHDGQTESVQALAHTLFWLLGLGRHVRVADVRREVD